MQFRILLVDDDGNILKAVCRTLTDDGYEIRKAANGREALELLANEKFDVVLTDYEMPEMNGLELVNAILKANLLKTSNIIMMSSALRPKGLDNEILFFDKSGGFQEIKKILKQKKAQ